MALIRCSCLWDNPLQDRTLTDPECPAHTRSPTMPRIPCTCRVPGMKCYAHPDGPACTCIRATRPGHHGDTTGDVTAPLVMLDPDCLHPIHHGEDTPET